jgi:hypothetical protein
VTELLASVALTIAVVAAPQPKHSEGLLVVYGSQYLVEQNAAYRGYTLGDLPDRCGMSGISPVMLGRLAYVRTPGHDWVGPCRIVDAVAAHDAVDSIEGRKEIAEITWDTAAALGFEHGGVWGEIWFDPCPPDPRARHQPERYTLTRDYSMWPWRWSSFYPYPAQEWPVVCEVVQ